MSTIPILLGLVLAVPANGDESVLAAARLPTTDKAILNFFHKRSQPPPVRAAIEQLARALGSNNPAEADDAHAELLGIGLPVVPVLREVANRVDLVRASKRAKQILLMIEAPEAGRLSIDAARWLASRKSPGAAEALLGYLPVADDDQVFEEIVLALGSLSFPEGKADPALLAALKSPKAFTRAAAARALCIAGDSAYWKAVRPLLTDSDPSVRFQVAAALADAHDGEAIPVLIECLSDGPLALAAQADEYLARLAGDWTVHAPRGSDIVSRELRRAIWAAWWAKTGGDLILRELKARTLTDDELDEARALLRKLETEQVETTGTASQSLMELGPRVGPLVRRALQQSDMRPSPNRARSLESIAEEFPPLPPPEPLFRILSVRRPPGTVAALLAFLPCAENEEMIAGIIPVLVEVGVVDGNADEALFKALGDKVGIRRAVAAVTLWRGHASGGVPAVRKLLTDKDLQVRRRVALGLAMAGDQDGAVVLTGLLEELPNEQAWEIEEQLERLAGGKAPAELIANPTNWKKVAGVWRQWWQGERGKVVMIDSFVPASGGSLRGFTLLVQQQSNTVTELGPDGRPRWTLTGLQDPSDAQVLANQHVLVAERGRVTERDLTGKVLWKLEGIRPLAVQRLAKGNTFIPCTGQLVEVDRAGKDILRVAVGDIVAARRLPDRRIVAFERGSIIQLDEAGREIKRVPAVTSGVIGGAGCNEVLDNGHVLVLSPGLGNITEFDMEGKQVGSFDVPGASHGFRLPNGHTLVTAERTKYVELDKNWKQIKETMLEAPAFRVKRR
jgi:HEAT repeat protein